MPRPVRAIDIYLPLDYNDGRPIGAAKYIPLEDELLARFGGVTSTQRLFPLRGLWQAGTQVFQDRVVVFSAMDFGFSATLADYRFCGSPKQASTRRRNCSKFLIPKARHRIARRPWLNPSVRPLLARDTK